MYVDGQGMWNVHFPPFMYLKNHHWRNISNPNAEEDTVACFAEYKHWDIFSCIILEVIFPIIFQP